MGQQVKVLTAKPDDHSSIPGTGIACPYNLLSDLYAFAVA